MISSCIWFYFVTFVPLNEKARGNSSVGRALASQAEGREFESRLPLKHLPSLLSEGIFFLHTHHSTK